MSWVASKSIGAHPRPGLQERSKGSQDLRARLFDRRSGPGLPLRRLRPSFCSRKLTKAAVAARGFKAGRFRPFGQTFKARRDRPIRPNIDECVGSSSQVSAHAYDSAAPALPGCQPRRASRTFACTALPPEAAAPSAPTARSADACRNAVASFMARRPSGMIIFNSGQACGMSG